MKRLLANSPGVWTIGGPAGRCGPTKSSAAAVEKQVLHPTYRREQGAWKIAQARIVVPKR